MKKGGLHPQHQPHQSEEKRGRCGRSSPSTAPAESEIQTEGKTWLGLYFLIQLATTFGAVFNLSQRLLLFSHFRLFSCFFSCHFICHSPPAKLPSGRSHLSHSLISTPVPHSLISYIYQPSFPSQLQDSLVSSNSCLPAPDLSLFQVLPLTASELCLVPRKNK